MRTSILRTVSMSVLVASLSACGGGGGGGGGVQPISAPPTLPAPTPAPPPTPAPTPAPPGIDGTGFDTAEYKNSAGAAQAFAIHAYEKGATGKGTTAAIIDTGLGLNLPAFAGRIHAASADLAGSRGLGDDFGHGTYMASIIGASKDGAGMHGVAFDATLLVLRTDLPGTCPTNCKFNEALIAKGIDVAVANNARVINISLGGNYPEFPVVVEAIDRATAAGVVIVVTAGNESAAGPIQSALVALDPAARGSVIIAGAANQAGTGLASLSNRAGSAAGVFLAAAGEKVSVYDEKGNVVIKGGTSVAAPAIAGAVALVAQAFPNMTGKQIVDLLLTTATDIDAPGADSISGRGMLNVGKAFAPQGTMTLAGSKIPVSLSSNGVLAPAMGDALATTTGAVFLDGYARAYEADFGRTLARTAPDTPLHAALGGRYSSSSAALGPLGVSVTTSRDPYGAPEGRLQPIELSPGQARAASAIAATAVGRLNAKTSVAFGLSESGQALQQRLLQQGSDAFLVARDPLAGNGFHGRIGMSAGIRHDFGPLALTMTSEGGDVHDATPASNIKPSKYRTSSLIAHRQLGPMRLSVGGSLLQEEATILGGRFSSAFSTNGSTSWFADGAASLDMGRGWGAQASYRQGWTSIPGGHALVTGGRLSSNAFAFDLTRSDAIWTGDRIALRVMQPLRVRTGGFDTRLPVSYDYASGDVGYRQSFFNLAPSGREVDYELSYRINLLGGQIAAHAFVRADPGHVDHREGDLGGALRFLLGF